MPRRYWSDQSGANTRTVPTGRPKSAIADLVYGFKNEHLADAQLKLLHALWEAGCNGHALPSRAHFDPVTMPRELLPWVTIFDVEYDPIRFRVRLVGTGIVSAMGMETTGAYLDQIAGFDCVIARANWLVRHRKPFFVSNQPLTWCPDRYSRYSVIGLPLATNGHDIDMLLYGMCFEQAPSGQRTAL